MAKQPSPFYDLFEGAYDAILTFPVDEEGCGPFFDAEGNLDLSKGAELSHESVQVVDLGGGRYRMGDNSLLMSGLQPVCRICPCMACAGASVPWRNGWRPRQALSRKSWATSPAPLRRNTTAAAPLTSCACGIPESRHSCWSKPASRSRRKPPKVCGW